VVAGLLLLGATAGGRPAGASEPAGQAADNAILAYLAGGDLWLARADGSGLRQLTDGGLGEWFAWSPRGGELLFATRATAPRADEPGALAPAALYVVGFDGAPLRQLDAGARVPTSKRRAGWSADGAWVVFADGDAVVIIDRQGQGGQRIVLSLPQTALNDLATATIYVGTPAFYPDGDALLVPAVSRSETGVGGNARVRFYALSLANSAVALVGTSLPVPTGRLPEDLSFAPGGRAFGYLSAYHVSGCEEYGYFARVDPVFESVVAVEPQPGAPPDARVTSPPDPLRQPGWGFDPRGYSWAPDGRRVALAFEYHSCGGEAPGGQSQLFLAGLPGEAELVGPGAYPAWSPGGDRLAYVAEGSPSMIRVRDLGTGAERDLVAGTLPAWQPRP
jgi:Tol biopolymer transport system component